MSNQMGTIRLPLLLAVMLAMVGVVSVRAEDAAGPSSCWVLSDDYDIYDPTSFETAAIDQQNLAATPTPYNYLPMYVPQLRATEGGYSPITTYKLKHDQSTLFPSVRATPAAHFTPEELESVKDAGRVPTADLPTTTPTFSPKRPVRSALHVMGTSHLAESHFFASDDARFQKWQQAEEVRLEGARKKLVAEYVRLKKEAAESYQDALDDESSSSPSGSGDASKADEKVLPLIQALDETIKRTKRRQAVFRTNTSSLKDRMTAVALDIRGLMKRLRGAYFPHPYVSGVRGADSPPSLGRHRLSKTEQGLPALRDTLLKFHVDDHMILNYQLNKSRSTTTSPSSASSESEEEQYERLLYGSDSYGLSGLVPGGASAASRQQSSLDVTPALTQRDYDLALFSLLRPTSFFDTIAATDAAAELTNTAGSTPSHAVVSDQTKSAASFVLGNGNIKASESPLHTQTFQAGRHNILTAAPRATFVPSSASPDGIIKGAFGSILHAGRRVLTVIQVAFRAVVPQSSEKVQATSIGELESGLDFPSLLSVPFLDGGDAEKIHEEYTALARDIATLEADQQNMERGSYRLDVLVRATRNVQQGVSGDEGGGKIKRKRSRAAPDADTSPEESSEFQTRVEDEVVVLSQTAPTYYKNLREHYMTPQITNELNRLYTALYFNQRVQWSLVHSSYPVLHKDILPSIQAAADELSGKMKTNDESTKAKRKQMKDNSVLYKRMTAEIKKLESLLRHCRRIITHYDVQSRQAHHVASLAKPTGLDMHHIIDLVKWAGIARRHRDVLGAALRLPDTSEAALAKLDEELAKEKPDTSSRKKGGKKGAGGKSAASGGMEFDNIKRPWEKKRGADDDDEESLYTTSISSHTADATTFRIFGLSQYEMIALIGSILIPSVLDAALIQSPIRFVAFLQWCVRRLIPWLAGRGKNAKGRAISKLINKKNEEDDIDPRPQRKTLLVRFVSFWVVLLGLWVRFYLAFGHFILPLLFPVILGVDSFERWVLQGTTQLRGLVSAAGVTSGVAGSGAPPHIHFTTQVLITRSQYVWLYAVTCVMVGIMSLVVLRPVFNSASHILRPWTSPLAKRKYR